MALVYSYLRFSTPEQAAGDSRRRQLALSDKWCKDRGLILDDSLRMSDEGISAYAGKNVAEGALRDFLSKLRNKDIRPGSFLLVESLDRISREDVFTALGLFSEIIRSGVKIVTLQDGIEYTRESIQDLGKLLYSVVVMSTANEESRKKSIRLRASWNNKRESAHKLPITKCCPSWIRLHNGKLIVIERKAKIIREIIAMSARGIGSVRIRNILNEKRTKSITGHGYRWDEAYIRTILKNGAPVGVYKPQRHDGNNRTPEGMVFESYYPAIVSKDLYAKSLECYQKRTRYHGETTRKCSNLFSQLVKWGPSDILESRNFKSYNFHKQQPLKLAMLNLIGRVVLVFNYHPFEEVVLRFLRELDLNEILRPHGVEIINRKIEVVEEKIGQIKNKISSNDKGITKVKASVKKLSRLPDLGLQLAKLDDELLDLQDLRRHKFSSDNKINELLLQPNTVDGRKRLASLLRRIIESIYIYRADNKRKYIIKGKVKYRIKSESKIIAVVVFKGDNKIEKAISIDTVNKQYAVISNDDKDAIIRKWNRGQPRKPTLNFRRWSHSRAELAEWERLMASAKKSKSGKVLG